MKVRNTLRQRSLVHLFTGSSFPKKIFQNLKNVLDKNKIPILKVKPALQTNSQFWEELRSLLKTATGGEMHLRCRLCFFLQLIQLICLLFNFCRRLGQKQRSAFLLQLSPTEKLFHLESFTRQQPKLGCVCELVQLKQTKKDGKIKVFILKEGWVAWRLIFCTCIWKHFLSVFFLGCIHRKRNISFGSFSIRLYQQHHSRATPLASAIKSRQTWPQARGRGRERQAPGGWGRDTWKQIHWDWSQFGFKKLDHNFVEGIMKQNVTTFNNP